MYNWRSNEKKNFLSKKKDVSIIYRKVQFHTWHIAKCSVDMQIDNSKLQVDLHFAFDQRKSEDNFPKRWFLYRLIDLSLIKSWWLRCCAQNNNVKHFLFDLPHLGKWTITVFIDTHNKSSVTSLISVELLLYPFLRLIQICFLFVENVYTLLFFVWRLLWDN